MQIKSVTVDLGGGKELVLSLEEARQLKQQLDSLFSVQQYIPYVAPVYIPSVWLPNTRMPEITYTTTTHSTTGVDGQNVWVDANPCVWGQQ